MEKGAFLDLKKKKETHKISQGNSLANPSAFCMLLLLLLSRLSHVRLCATS